MSPISTPTPRHILDYTSIRNGTTGYEPLRLKRAPTINTSTSFFQRKLTSPRRSVSNFDAPPYNRLCQFRHDTDTDTPSHMTVFRFVCRAEVNIAAEKRLQFRHRHRQHNPRLGPRGYVRESTMLQLVGAVPSIQFFSAIPITIQQDCVSPSEERLTGSQDS